MPEKEVQTEAKEITLDELKTLISDSLKDIVPSIKEDITKELKPQVVVKTEEEQKKEDIEKAGQFIKDLCNGKIEMKTDTPISSDTSSMGYTIPTELTNIIMTKKYALAKMRKLAFIFAMAGPISIPIEGTGVTCYWVDENAEITDSTPTVTKADLSDHYLAARVIMPRLLLHTSQYNITEYVSNLAARKMVVTEEAAFVAGDGSSKPTGFRQADISSQAQAGASLAYDDVVDLFYSVPEQYRMNGVFMTSTTGLMALRKIKDQYGLPIFNVTEQTVFNRPIIENVNIPDNLGSSTDETEFYFFDPSYYWIKDSEAMFALSLPIIKNLQIEIVIAEAVDGIYTMTEAAYKLTGVK